MATGDVTPNRRGVRSRDAVLDAAERVMAEHGCEGATAAQIVALSGIPVSSVYHYFGSKQGVLLAVMERGARRFFDSLPAVAEREGAPEDHLRHVIDGIAAALEEQPDFLRLVLVMATQPVAGDDVATAQEVVSRVRREALGRLRALIAMAFDDLRPSDESTDRLARLTLAAIDGAFVASQADGARLRWVLEPLPAALVAARDQVTG